MIRALFMLYLICGLLWPLWLALWWMSGGE